MYCGKGKIMSAVADLAYSKMMALFEQGVFTESDVRRIVGNLSKADKDALRAKMLEFKRRNRVRSRSLGREKPDSWRRNSAPRGEKTVVDKVIKLLRE